MFRLISSKFGRPVQLPLALGPILVVTLMEMLFVCKILVNVPFPFLNHIMLGDGVVNKSQLLLFMQCFIPY